ncbi:MAG: hypothetical protein EP324_08205 [Gammaproteobacteria bacterium]|nr:MAG: hypothetical protein EP324_08205 [Gammaproteobacteria bacterium]
MFPAHHLDLAVLCDAAYDTSRSDIWSVAENDVLAWERDNVVVLSCRGTEASKAIHKDFSLDGLRNTRDILKDLRFWPYKMPNDTWVHKGFGRAAEVWCEAYALKLVEVGKPIVLTGHSLGAAMAVQMAAILKNMGLAILEVVVFGEPAGFYFGSEKQYRFLNIPTTSYLHANDWIRFAPPFGSTSVERTPINPKKGISRKAHDINEYVGAMG